MPNRAPEPEEGALVAGKYRVFADIGRGGMADVFLAVNQGPMGFNKLVVVKRLRQALADDQLLTSMFLDEARLAARLNHSNIVHTYEVGKYEGGFFIAMEYLEGQSLAAIAAEAIRQERDPGQRVWARICASALTGLHYAHELKDYDGKPIGVIHRDVSPHNILVTYEGEVKLVDFGIAKATINTTVTEGKTIKGKVAYMAPEQAEGQEIDRRADIFAMGVVLWGLLAGERLFGGDAVRALDKLRHARIPRVSEVAEVDPKLDDVVARALERDPDKRYQTAEEMKDALEAYLREAGEVRNRDVAALVADLFKEKREETRLQIQRHMSDPDRRTSLRNVAVLALGSPGSGSSRSGRKVSSSAEITAAAPSSSEESARLRHDGTPLATHSSVKMSAAESAGASARARNVVLAVGGVGVAVLVGALLVGGPGSPSQANDAARTSNAAPPSPSVPPPAAPPASAPATASVAPVQAAPSASASPSVSPPPSAAPPPRAAPPAPPPAPPGSAPPKKPVLDPDPWR